MHRAAIGTDLCGVGDERGLTSANLRHIHLKMLGSGVGRDGRGSNWGSADSGGGIRIVGGDLRSRGAPSRSSLCSSERKWVSLVWFLSLSFM